MKLVEQDALVKLDIVAGFARRFFLLLVFVAIAQQIAQAQMPGRQRTGDPPPPPGADPSQEPAATPPVPQKPKIVYVTDFDWDPGTPAAVAVETSAGTPRNGQSATSNGLAAEAQHMVKLMSENLLKDFAKAGYLVKMLHPSNPKPDDGFLIAGVFTQVDSQNRLHRAVISPDQNSSPIELYVAAEDLSRFTVHLYKTSETEDRTKNPRAVIEINPEADPEKFPIDPNASEKAVKQTAQRITNEMIKRIDANPKYEQLNRYAKP
ncbi:MAG: DUF4410 domain-containing protein [Candidatus Acidiferrales bacterium]